MQMQIFLASVNPIQSRGGGIRPPPPGFFFIIPFEQFRIQSSNYTIFPSILYAIFLSVFQHYLRRHVAIVTDNLDIFYTLITFGVL